MMVGRNIRLLYIFNFLLDFRLYAAVIILYFAKVTGSFALGMSIFSITMISSALFELPTGIFSDLIGRKKTVILGSLMSICALISYALGGTYLMLVIGALFEGASRAFFSGNNDALLFESLKQNNKEHTFAHYSGRVSSMFQIALAVASLCGGFIAIWSFSLVMWLSVLPQIGCFLISLFMVEPEVSSSKETNIYSHLKEALIQIKQNKKLKLLNLASIIRESVGESVFLFRPAFIATLWPVWAIGLSITASYMLGSIGFYLSGKVIKRFSALKTLIGEIVINRIINGVALVFQSVVSPALLSFTSFMYGPGQVAIGTLMQKEFTNEQRTTLGSLNSLGASILFGIAAVGLGIIADKFGPVITLLVANLILLVPLYFYWQIFRHDKNSEVSY